MRRGEEKKIKLYLKLCKANKCLYVIRCLRKEGCSQAEVDHLFSSIVLPNVTYALSVYGASESELTIAQQFLDRLIILNSPLRQGGLAVRMLEL